MYSCTISCTINSTAVLVLNLVQLQVLDSIYTAVQDSTAVGSYYSRTGISTAVLHVVQLY